MINTLLKYVCIMTSSKVQTFPDLYPNPYQRWTGRRISMYSCTRHEFVLHIIRGTYSEAGNLNPALTLQNCGNMLTFHS